jgi:hypothetical protein
LLFPSPLLLSLEPSARLVSFAAAAEFSGERFQES